MKFSELDLTKYEYKRVCVTDPASITHFPVGTEKRMTELLGERELDGGEEGVRAEGGWLYVKLK